MMADLATAYRPVMGKQLNALTWLPIQVDEADLRRSLEAPFLCYSGAVTLDFEGCALSLTWSSGRSCTLGPMAEDSWRPGTLVEVPASPEGPWGALLGTTLQAVTLYGHDSAPGRIVAARHEVLGPDGPAEFWIGVGRGRSMREGDDLVACVGGAPENAKELKPLTPIGQTDATIS